MANKMLIDATHPEETRVVVVRGNRVEEFDYESASRKQLRGNIYLAKVTRVEPSLQAAFIEYGGNRHGFLAFSEIHPDYYQIPIADRLALIEEEERAARLAEEEADLREKRRDRSRSRRSRADASVSEDVSDADEVEEIDSAADAAPAADIAPSDAEAPAVAAVAEVSASADAADLALVPPVSPAAIADEKTASVETADESSVLVAPVPGEAGTVDQPSASIDEAPVEVASAVDVAPAEAVRDNATLGEADAEQAAFAPTGDERHPAEASPLVDDDEDEDDGDVDQIDEEEEIEHLGADEDALEEVPERAPQRRARSYKIQEVIRRRQVMLVQVVKEERGNKGAALTTYLSLAGRYSVLMPNTARGGGISRKITNAADRKRLKEVVQELEVPEGMGVILRTAGANRTKTEIKRDFEYLLRLWETVRELTLSSAAPSLVYEEGSLIKRAIRDLYNKDIDEILVAGEEGHAEAREFMRMLMPSHAKLVLPYNDPQPIFARYGVEQQLDAMFSPVVQLKSGGYIVINPTEALVSIDVNSGRATREHHIEDTALKTNLEASEEIARQLRLRDLAGLIVIDFIDMEEKRNNRAVERKLKDCLKNDRARIQIGRISHFGLLEMSRQRIRTGVLESSIEVCPHCGGTGHVRSAASVALQLLRAIEEQLLRAATHNLIARTRAEVALYVLNQKRAHLSELERRFNVNLFVTADETVIGHQPFVIDKGDLAVPSVLVPHATPVVHPDSIVLDEVFEEEAAEEEIEEAGEADSDADTPDKADDSNRRRRRRRRRRRPGEREENHDASGDADEDDDVTVDGGESAAPVDENEIEGEVESESGSEDEALSDDERGDDEANERRRRRRGRRGGRRNRREREGEDGADEAETVEPSTAEEMPEHIESAVRIAIVREDEDHIGEASAAEVGVSAAEVGDVRSAAIGTVEPEVVATDAEPVIEPAPIVPEPVSAEAGSAEPISEDVAPTSRRRRSTVREKALLPPSASVSTLEEQSLAVEPPEEAEASTPVAAEPALPEAEPVQAGEVAGELPSDSSAETAAAKPRSGWWQRKPSAT